MKFTGSVLAAAALTNTVSAHYFFDKLIVDGVETRAGQYVRANTRKESYMPTKWKNTFDNLTPDDNDFRCNLGAFTNAGKTQTMEIKAGAKLGMKLGVGATMQHPGPQMVYMSKAPTTAQAYEGDGEWFKIYEAGICDDKKDILKDAWCSWDKSSIDFTVPKDLPDGEYLVRAEHIGLHGAHDGQAEFYYECAQVKVTGGGSGTPGPTVKFPGAYKKTDPEVNFSIWGGMRPYSKIPGPAVWTGGSSGSNGNATKEETPSSSAPVASKPSSAPVASKPSTSAPVATKPATSAPVATKPSASAPIASNPSFSGRPRPSGRPSGRPFPRPSGKPFTYTPAAPKPTYPAPINDDEPSYTPVAPKPASPAPVNNDESSSNTPVAPKPVSPTPVTDGSDKANTKATAHNDENCGGRLARTRRAFREMFLNKA